MILTFHLHFRIPSRKSSVFEVYFEINDMGTSLNSCRLILLTGLKCNCLRNFVHAFAFTLKICRSTKGKVPWVMILRCMYNVLWCLIHIHLQISVVRFSLVRGHFQKIAQISSLCDFHYICEGIHSLMRFWLLMT